VKEEPHEISVRYLCDDRISTDRIAGIRIRCSRDSVPVQNLPREIQSALVDEMEGHFNGNMITTQSKLDTLGGSPRATRHVSIFIWPPECPQLWETTSEWKPSWLDFAALAEIRKESLAEWSQWLIKPQTIIRTEHWHTCIAPDSQIQIRKNDMTR